MYQEGQAAYNSQINKLGRIISPFMPFSTFVDNSYFSDKYFQIEEAKQVILSALQRIPEIMELWVELDRWADYQQ